MAKKTAGPKAKKQPHSPLALAILTGGALPAKFSPFEAMVVGDPDHPRAGEPGSGMLLSWGPHVRDLWRQFHGRDMSDDEAAAIRARRPEIDAAVAAMRGEAPRPGPAVSNWPASETDGFKSLKIQKKSLDCESGFGE